MSLRLKPDFMFDSFSYVTVDFMKKNGFSGIILDVDNTLEPYENPLPTEKVQEWFRELREAGISFAIVSNNSKDRIDLFNSALNIVTYSKSKKPFSKYIRMAMENIGTNKDNTVFMGDQIFTDVWGAHNAGIKAILVPPIKDKTDIFTRFKRLLEKPIIRSFKRREKSKCSE